MTLLFFNLLTNATFSLIVGLLVVGFFIWFFRVETGPWKVFLLSLPFLKIVIDVARGLPANSVLLAGIDPYVLPPKHQTLQIGAGFNEWGPIFSTTLSVRDLRGNEYASSIGDYLAIWTQRSLGGDWLLAIVTLIAGVSAILILKRVFQFYMFEEFRCRDRGPAQDLFALKTRFRVVDIYTTAGFHGTPFTGGLFKPYICIPQDAFSILSEQELDAVIQHEMGHIQNFDLLVTIAVQGLGDLFWFVPGYRWLTGKIDSLREIIADHSAVKAGADPLMLASAILKLKEVPETPEGRLFYSAFFRKKSLLKERIGRLLGSVVEPPSRFAWRHSAVKVIATFWIVMSVMMATFGGNHSVASTKNPEWFEKLMHLLGV